MTFDERVAIVGMHVKLPAGIDSTEQLWRLLIEGRDVFARGPVTDAHVSISSDIGDVDLFAADHFGVPAFEAELMDPQHRLLMEMCWECLATAESDRKQVTGVFTACSPSSYFERILLARPEVWERSGDQILLGTHPDFLATKIAYRLDLTGPAMHIGTGCSSALVAVSQAVNALNTLQCDRMLVAAASIHNENGYAVRQGAINSPDGFCRPFSDDANGTVPGNGAAVILLKRLEDAVADGDHVHAVIEGSAVGNDGRRKVGFTAPSVEGQYECIAAALDVAQVDPADVRYIEAHGTGTIVGDPIELRALAKAYGPGSGRFVGSIKANIGHCDATAGLFGLIKAALVLENGVVPPQINVTAPTSKHDWSDGRLRLAQAPVELSGGPLVAAVSSLGVGGTNAHVLLTDAHRFGTGRGPRPVVRLTGRKPYGIDTSMREAAAAQVAPAGTVTDETLLEMFSSHTSVAVTSIDDSYFECGGDSIGLIYLLEELSGVAGRAIPMEEFMRTPTVRFVKELIGTAARDVEGDARAAEVDDRTAVEAEVSAQLSGRSMMPAGNTPIAGDANAILLSGATGFVGAFVLAELLTRGTKVVCLVRGGESRRDDLIGSMRDLGAWRSEHDGLLTVVEGDVGQPRLGLDPVTHAALCDGVGRIIHCAAWVNHLYPYGRLATVNTHSAVDLLELAVSARRKSLTFVSTSAVFAGPADGEESEFGAGALTSFPSERDGYARSKAIAEMFFVRAGEFGVPATIVRIPNIFGDRVRFQINRRDGVWGWVKAILATGHYPAGYGLAGNDFVQALPGDVAARLIADAGSPSDSPGCRIINAIPNLVCSTRSLLAGLSAAGHDPRPMDDREWYGLVGGLSAHEIWVAPIAADHAGSGGDDAPVRLPRVSLHDHPEVSQLVNAHAIWSPSDLAGYIRTLAGS